MQFEETLFSSLEALATVDNININIGHINKINKTIEHARRHQEILNKYLFAPTWSESTELIKNMSDEL